MVEGEKEITKGRSNAIPRSLTMALKEERILRERNDERGEIEIKESEERGEKRDDIVKK